MSKSVSKVFIAGQWGTALTEILIKSSWKRLVGFYLFFLNAEI